MNTDRSYRVALHHYIDECEREVKQALHNVSRGIEGARESYEVWWKKREAGYRELQKLDGSFADKPETGKDAEGAEE